MVVKRSPGLDCVRSLAVGFSESSTASRKAEKAVSTKVSSRAKSGYSGIRPGVAGALRHVESVRLAAMRAS